MNNKYILFSLIISRLYLTSGLHAMETENSKPLWENYNIKSTIIPINITCSENGTIYLLGNTSKENTPDIFELTPEKNWDRLKRFFIKKPLFSPFKKNPRSIEYIHAIKDDIFAIIKDESTQPPTYTVQYTNSKDYVPTWTQIYPVNNEIETRQLVRLYGLQKASTVAFDTQSDNSSGDQKIIRKFFPLQDPKKENELSKKYKAMKEVYKYKDTTYALDNNNKPFIFHENNFIPLKGLDDTAQIISLCPMGNEKIYALDNKANLHVWTYNAAQLKTPQPTIIENPVSTPINADTPSFSSENVSSSSSSSSSSSGDYYEMESSSEEEDEETKMNNSKPSVSPSTSISEPHDKSTTDQPPTPSITEKKKEKEQIAYQQRPISQQILFLSKKNTA